MIEIKNIDGVVLYTAETATDVRAALEEAVGAGTDLYRARLVGARLDGARLVGARLVGARLVGARLVGARLDGARLDGARLDGARLDGARLDGARLDGASLDGARLDGARLDGARLDRVPVLDRSHPLHFVRQDFWSVLDEAPLEVPALREALVTGQVDGSTYTGQCSCLVGTIAQARGVATESIPSRGFEGLASPVRPDASRPAEVWFLPIRPGQCAVPEGEMEQERTEGLFRARLALRWVDEWTESRIALAAALSPGDTAGPECTEDEQLEAVDHSAQSVVEVLRVLAEKEHGDLAEVVRTLLAVVPVTDGARGWELVAAMVSEGALSVTVA
jgi:hypothetical protein